MGDPPFTRQPSKPPLHLRELTPEEVEKHRKLVKDQELMWKLWKLKQEKGQCAE